NTPHPSVNDTGMIDPPRRATALVFASGAVSGITTLHGRSIRLANQATACAMFPALAVHTPFASSSSDSDPISEPAPRILKEPIGCRTSSFREISGVGAAPGRG